MNFVTHRILNPAGKGPSFKDWMENYLQKLAADKQAECKEMGDCTDAGKVTEKHSPAASGDGVVSSPINNDPCYQTGESVDGVKKDEKKAPAKKEAPKAEKKEEKSEKKEDKKGDKKEASAKPAVKEAKKTEDEPTANINNNVQNDPELPKEDKKKAKKCAESTGGFKKIAELERAEKLQLFATLSANPKNPIQYVEAMVGLKFANMTDEEKTWFKKFWGVLYPESYVTEMVKDR